MPSFAEARRPGPDGARTHVHLKVVPGGSRDALGGPLGDRLKVRVSAPPEGGKANRAVLKLLADALGLSVRALTIVRGASSPLKTVEVNGLGPEDVGRLLYG